MFFFLLCSVVDGRWLPLHRIHDGGGKHDYVAQETGRQMIVCARGVPIYSEENDFLFKTYLNFPSIFGAY